MGLDMYAFSVAPESIEVDDDSTIRGIDENTETTKIAYWRKHNALHGWIEDMYRKKGGTEESFNCIPVEITSDDLDQLERDVEDESMKGVEGFFFGGAEYSEEDKAYYKEEDLKFISAAREAMNAGQVVYYDSWW